MREWEWKRGRKGHVMYGRKSFFKSNEFPNYSYVSVAACLTIIWST